VLGAGDSRGHGGFVFDRLILPAPREVYANNDWQEATVRRSGLDWTLVRPMVLTDKPATGQVRAPANLAGIHGGSIRRGDVAGFVVAELTDERWTKQAPLIGLKAVSGDRHEAGARALPRSPFLDRERRAAE
jgi:hypothetical protein